MEELAYLLVNHADDSRLSEKLLNDYYTKISAHPDWKGSKSTTVLYHFLSRASDSTFRRLFHLNKETIPRIAREIRGTKTFRLSSLCNKSEEEVVEFICFAVLYIHTCFSLRCCAQFCGISHTVAENYVSLFNKMMNEVRDKIICFPALNYQSLLKVDSKRFFPGAVGVVDTVFIPKLYSLEDMEYSCSTEYHRQGVKILVVVGRDGRFFNIHISENGSLSNCKVFNESALGYTLRFHKRSVLNRGSFLIADRSFPELPYLQIPFSNAEIRRSQHRSVLSNYNYWHHKARFVAEKSLNRWLRRSPKCRCGLPFSSPRSSVLFVISSLVLNQMCNNLGDEWSDDDSKIRCVAIASCDGEEVDGVNEECYKLYDSPDGPPCFENDYYDLNMVTVSRDNGEVVDEALANSTYERLKVVSRKRRDFLVELVNQFTDRSVVFYDE